MCKFITMETLPKQELLSPAGNLSKLKYAIAYGADATYAGIPKFSLRTRENEFREDTLKEAISYSHNLGKQIYLTMNIYAHNTKVDAFIRELDKVISWEPDALIMADPGLINIARKRHPNMVIHLSTQANATNWSAVQFWHDLGVKRIILSRELRLKEIAQIHENVPDIELEAFVHGAICIAYSGRCLITNYMNHRDANQGTCTNSCRWEYKVGEVPESLIEIETQQESLTTKRSVEIPNNLYVEEPTRPGEKYAVDEDEHGTYMFNAKDLCSIELLNDIQKAGVISYKIEGRTKSEYYAAMCTRSYRKAIDDVNNGNPFNPQHLEDLMALSNRSYTTGFYTRNPREFGENYTDSRSKELLKRAVGMDVKYDASQGLLYFECKNRLEVGTEVEIITPDGESTVKVEEIVSSKGKKLEVAHGGMGVHAIPFDTDPGEFAVLRRNIYPKELESALKV